MGWGWRVPAWSCAAPVPCPRDISGCPCPLGSRLGAGPGWLRPLPQLDVGEFTLGKSPAASPACAKGTQGRSRGTPLAVPGEGHIWGIAKPASACGAPGRCLLHPLPASATPGIPTEFYCKKTMGFGFWLPTGPRAPRSRDCGAAPCSISCTLKETDCTRICAPFVV